MKSFESVAGIIEYKVFDILKFKTPTQLTVLTESELVQVGHIFKDAGIPESLSSNYLRVARIARCVYHYSDAQLSIPFTDQEANRLYPYVVIDPCDLVKLIKTLPTRFVLIAYAQTEAFSEVIQAGVACRRYGNSFVLHGDYTNLSKTTIIL
jgi:hypothetical protein